MGARRNVRIAVGVAAAAALGVGAATVAARDNSRNLRERLSGYEESLPVSTNGTGTFRASIDRSDQEIRYRVTFSGLTTTLLQAHIHFENETNNGPIVVFLCGPGPEGTPACPASTSGSFEGTIDPADVLGNAADRGLAEGEFDELVRAIDAGATYVNLHTTDFPAGEIRGQIDDD
jgi:CHRD domain